MKYCLKKDLPWAKAGSMALVWKEEQETRYLEMVAQERKLLVPFPLSTFSDWFEEVDERWKPNEREQYWYLDSVFMPTKTTWNIDSSDESWHSIGNCFRTRELAERAAEQIKALLKEFHKNNP